MDLFSYEKYRNYLKDLCTSRRSQRGFQSSLARAAGCQSAYFSQVLKHNVHLTEDQVIALGEELALSPLELEYLLVLLRLEKAGTEKLKTYLRRKLSDLRLQNQDLSSRVPADQILLNDKNLGKYFSSWIPSAVHLLTSCEKYNTPEKIAARLHVPLRQIKEILQFLSELGWVEKKNQSYFYSGGNIHIPKTSAFHSTAEATRRQLALSSIAVNNADDIHYSSVFTIDQKDFAALKNMIGTFVQESSQVIKNSGTAELSCLCVDLFQVP